jgi:hypothetical protein
MSIREALQLKNAEFLLKNGTPYTLRRPSAFDLIEAFEYVKDNPTTLQLYLIMKHLMEDGKPVFNSVDEVKAADARTIGEISLNIDLLYGEGRD